MENLFNFCSMLSGLIVGVLIYVFGGVDVLMRTLLTLIVLDYLTGVLKAVYNKRLSSEIGFKGIVKKMMILLLVAAAVMIQNIMSESLPIREVMITFFIANEGLSLLENVSDVIPVPANFKKLLLQLKTDTVKKRINEEDESEGK